MTEIKMPTHCIICGKKFNRWKFWWELEKIWLRITEVSLLWENCCSEKCYGLLLEKIMSGEIKLTGKEQVDVKEKEGN